MSFEILVGDKVVHTLDIDSRLVGGFTVGVDKLPVQFSQDSIRLDPVFKSPNDAEYLASLRAEEEAERKEAVEQEHAAAIAEITEEITNEDEEAEVADPDNPEMGQDDLVDFGRVDPNNPGELLEESDVSGNDTGDSVDSDSDSSDSGSSDETLGDFGTLSPEVGAVETSEMERPETDNPNAGDTPKEG